MMVFSMFKERDGGRVKDVVVEVKLKKDELDLIAWCLEAFVVKAEGQPVQGPAAGLLEDFKAILA